MTEQIPSVHERLMKADNPQNGVNVAQHSHSPIGTTSRSKQFALWAVAAVALIGIGVAASQIPALLNAAGPGQAEAKDAHQGTESAKNIQAANQPFMKHALDAGVRSCSEMYSTLGEALAGGTDYMVQTQTAKADADQHSILGVVGIAFRSEVEGGYKGAAAGVVLASPVSNGCEGAMVRVVPFVQNCNVAATFLPPGSQALKPLTGLPFYALKGGGQAILMPSGQGCVAISIVRSGV